MAHVCHTFSGRPAIVGALLRSAPTFTEMGRLAWDVASPSHLLRHISRWISFIDITLDYVTLGYPIHYHILYTVLYHIESHCISHHVISVYFISFRIVSFQNKIYHCRPYFSFHTGFYHITFMSHHTLLYHVSFSQKTYLDLTSSNIKSFDSNIWRLCEHSHHANFLLSHPEIQSVQRWFHPPKFRFSALRVR